MKGKKILIIVIIIVAVLAVAGTAFGYLYLKTDTFKSSKELFARYMNQNLEILQNMMNSQIVDTYKNLKNEEKYESNTDIKVKYSEGGEISNPLNNLAAKINVQKDDSQNYFYADGQILFADEEYLETEIIKDQGMYGVRFSDVVKQFVTIKNDENLATVANDVGAQKTQLVTIMDIIDGNKGIKEGIVSQEEIQSLKEKYFDIIVNAVLQGKFEKQMNSMITYKNTTTRANTYMVTLSGEQVENMVVQILNNVKTDLTILNKFSNVIDKEKVTEQIDAEIKKITEEQEISAIKITLNENNAQILQTIFEIGTVKITMENAVENGETKVYIQLEIAQENKVAEYNITISKKTATDQEKIEISFENLNSDESYTIDFLNEMQEETKLVTLKSELNYKKDIITTGITLENTVNIDEDFEKKQTLNEQNNVNLNDLSEENRKKIIETLKKNVPERVAIRLGLLNDAIAMKDDGEETPLEEEKMTQVEINRFNAKFEFYIGESVSADNVKVLLGIVKDNLESAEITQIETPEDPEKPAESIKPEDIKYNIKLKIEKEKVNEEETNKVLEKIIDKKKYKVSISYKEADGLIDFITINEVKD